MKKLKKLDPALANNLAGVLKGKIKSKIKEKTTDKIPRPRLPY